MLRNAGVAVTLLESGGPPPRGFRVRAHDRDVLTVLPRRSMPARNVAPDGSHTVWHFELAAGGLSNWWAGTTPRFAPQDFTDGERLDARYRWPLDYLDLVPFYERVERLMRITGAADDAPCVPACAVSRPRSLPSDWRAIGQAAESRGQALLPRPIAGGPRFEITTRGTTFNSFSDVLARIPRSADFHVVLGAHVLRIEHDDRARPRASAVIYRERSTGVEHRVAASAVVVAAGALASTRLLLASTSREFPNGFGNTDGVLGHYLHDHPLLMTYVCLDRPLTRIPDGAYLTRADYARSEPLRAVGAAVGSVRFLRTVAERRPGLLRTRDIACTWFGTVVPREHSAVALRTEQHDEFGLPGLSVTLAEDDRTPGMLENARARFLDMLREAGWTGHIEREFARPPGDSVHFGGTVRMHASPRYGMLDGFNRMHAVRNVVVVDSSAFTTGAEKNPTLTLMALSARAAAKLAADLRAGDC
jgi:choline dehydrogenase-like flavoprotein